MARSEGEAIQRRVSLSPSDKARAEKRRPGGPFRIVPAYIEGFTMTKRLAARALLTFFLGMESCPTPEPPPPPPPPLSEKSSPAVKEAPKDAKEAGNATDAKDAKVTL